MGIGHRIGEHDMPRSGGGDHQNDIARTSFARLWMAYAQTGDTRALEDEAEPVVESDASPGPSENRKVATGA
jgi:hypothetical protein